MRGFEGSKKLKKISEVWGIFFSLIAISSKRADACHVAVKDANKTIIK